MRAASTVVTSREPWRFVATVGYAGLSPVAPGTLGALVALGVGQALFALHWKLWIPILAVATFASIPAVDRYLRGGDLHDPQEVVLDEFIGCLLALALVPAKLPWQIAAFGLFRVMDIYKPGPIRVLERLPGGAGVVLDDVGAGIVAGALLAALGPFLR
jgi:phosphatidylglycerophosphatase A